ncbi:hypothetical protein VNI00_014087 [Paramarasmius palmivorus]|uniref:Uncharacterized protein n=1 Tax=Paramarasmius palmivorus TaxID=297713 RepID=A0AAW0BUF7_9AGAR
MPPFYAVLANYNINTKQQFLRDSSLIYFENATKQSYMSLRNYIQMGYSLARAYLAFTGADHLLDLAKSVWDDVNQYTISEGDISTGNMSTKNVAIPQQCKRGETLTGATFQNVSRDDIILSVYDTAFFFMFSATLASLESSPNNTYVSVARNSFNFLMHSSIGPLFPSVIEVNPCQNVVIVQPMRGTSTIGLLIEGLSLLASLQSDVEPELESMLPKLIMQVFNETANGWPSPAGILPGMTGCDGWCTGTPTFSSTNPPFVAKMDTVLSDVALARGMAVAYKQARSLSSDLRDAIKAFLGVQYNAVRKRAHLGNDIYDGTWKESHPSSPFDLMNQSSAIQILVDGISLFEDDHNDTPNATSHKSHSFPIPALAGSIVGGILFVTISVLAIILIIRWRNLRPSVRSRTFPMGASNKAAFGHHSFKGENTDDTPEGPVTPSPPIMDDAPTEKQPHEVPSPPDVRPIGNEHNAPNNSTIAPIADHHATSEVPVIHGPSFPDMIRMMYQQMWQPDNTESPPDTQVKNTRQDRVHAADAAIQQVAYRLDSDGSVPGLPIDPMSNFYEVLSNYNIETKQQFLHESFMNWNPTTNIIVGSLMQTHIQMGYSLARAYLAFTGVDHLLDTAKGIWDAVNQYTISESDINIGNMSTKNFRIIRPCGNIIIAGATFQNSSRDDTLLSLDVTALFFLFSATLASLENPPNNTYVSAARNSFNFLMQPYLNPLFPSVLIQPILCQKVLKFQQTSGKSTIGLLIEGLSLLAYLPSGVEPEIQSMLPKLIMQVLNETTNGWPSPGGILPGIGPDLEYWITGPFTTTSSQNLDISLRDIALTRGMAVAYKLARSLSSDMRDAIKAFLGVQVSVPLQNTELLLICSKYNAVRKRALLANDIYDGTWTESHPSSTFDLLNQSSAIQVLVDGISLFEDETPNDFPTPALAGSIVGGVLFVAISVLAIILLLRRRNLQRSLSETTSHISSDPFQFDPQYEIVPFQWESQTKLPLDTTRSKSRTQKIPEGPVTPSAPIMDDAPQTEKQQHEEVPPLPDVRPIGDEHNTPNNSNVVPIADHATSVVPVIHEPSIPDMIRMIYQQMLQQDNTESPPDYRSQS